jgi:hypothetical protein
MKYLSAIFLLSCVEFSQPFERSSFENEWWEIQEYSLCFNFHESGDLLSYQEQDLDEGEWGQFIDEGGWAFYEPNEYTVLEKSVFIYNEEECWKIEEYFENKTIAACECMLF